MAIRPRRRTPPSGDRTLDRVAVALAARYDIRFILVDDGSTDRTWDALTATFTGRPGFDLVRHEKNRGVAAAIMTGIRRAKTEIVCSMDCDCTYDPLEWGNMIPLLRPGVDLVTASPYHPAGHVRNVPGWRLVLSRGASFLYRRVLRQKLHTYTSCFRVYRRRAVAELPVENGRFLGIAEMAGRLDLAGGTIVEHPATLEVRMLGRSKIKTVRTVLGHLGLMARLTLARLRAARAPRAALPSAGVWLVVAVEHIFYSQYHRFYTLAALLVACATLAAARAVRTGSGRWMALACVFAGMAVLAHTIAGAVFGVLMIGGIVAAVGGKWRPAIVAFGGAVVAAAWLALVILPVVGAKAGLTSWTGLTSTHALLGAVIQVSWPVCVLAAAGAIVMWRRDRAQAMFWTGGASVWVGQAVVLPAVLPYHSAYIFPFALPVFVLAAFTAVEVAAAVRQSAGPTAGWLVWLGLPLLNLPALASYYQDGNRHDFRTAAAYVAERIGPADRVISNEPDKLAHYHPALASRLLHLPRADSPQEVIARVPDGGRLWVVCSGGRGGFEPGWQDWVHRHCHPQTVVARPRYDYYAFPVWVFRTPAVPAR